MATGTQFRAWNDALLIPGNYASGIPAETFPLLAGQLYAGKARLGPLPINRVYAPASSVAAYTAIWSQLTFDDVPPGSLFNQACYSTSAATADFAKTNIYVRGLGASATSTVLISKLVRATKSPAATSSAAILKLVRPTPKTASATSVASLAKGLLFGITAYVTSTATATLAETYITTVLRAFSAVASAASSQTFIGGGPPASPLRTIRRALMRYLRRR